MPWRDSSRKRFGAYQAKRQARPNDRHRPLETPEGAGGHGVALAPTATRSLWRLGVAFVRLLRPYRPVVALALTTVTTSTLLALVPLYGIKLVIDHVLGGHPFPEGGLLSQILPQNPKALLLTIAATMVALSAASVTLGMIGRWQMTRTTKRLQAHVRRGVFEHAARLPLHKIFRLKSGGIASVLSDDATAVGDLLFAMLYNPWRALVQLTGSLIVLTVTDWRMLLGSVAVLPVVWWTHKTWFDRLRPRYKDIRASRQHLSAHATEVFAGMRVVRGFNRLRTEAQRFMTNNHFMARQELTAWWWARTIDMIWSVLIPVASAGLLAYGGLRILNDAEAVRNGLLAPEAAFTIGNLVLFLSYLAWLLEPIATLAGAATELQNGLAGLDRILDLLDEPRELGQTTPGSGPQSKSNTSNQMTPGAVSGRVTLRAVSFTYPDTTQPVLRDIDLDAQPGQTIAFVGPSGAGKTTLCNLIARFYDPTAGAIELDGVDLRQIHVDHYRSLLGIVEQDVFLFDGTVAQNIAYARRHASHDQTVRAARVANAHGFISKLPQGYNTIIGERGVRLSGGQRQRLAIARAVLADPRILILDEATSSLDTESERLIQASLRALMTSRTCFVIAHRLSTITHADLIVVLDEGRVVERGRHDELMRQSSRYRRMVTLQTRPPEVMENLDMSVETLEPALSDEPKP